jgi:hypothetical protein
MAFFAGTRVPSDEVGGGRGGGRGGEEGNVVNNLIQVQ